MIYSKSLTVPAQTPRSSPVKTVCHVTRGLVYKLEIRIPPGHAGLTGIWITHGGFQVWPSTLGEYFVGDDDLISYEDVYLLESAPYCFNIYAFNNDDTFPHSFYVRFGVVSKEIYMARYLPTLSHDYLANLIKQLQEEQLERQREQESLLLENPFPWVSKEES